MSAIPYWLCLLPADLSLAPSLLTSLWVLSLISSIYWLLISLLLCLYLPECECCLSLFYYCPLTLHCLCLLGCECCLLIDMFSLYWTLSCTARLWVGMFVLFTADILCSVSLVYECCPSFSEWLLMCSIQCLLTLLLYLCCFLSTDLSFTLLPCQYVSATPCLFCSGDISYLFVIFRNRKFLFLSHLLKQ